MFSHHPALKNRCNRGNQLNSKQQTALVLAVLAHAENIEHLIKEKPSDAFFYLERTFIEMKKAPDLSGKWSVSIFSDSPEFRTAGK
jgi:hypothetical protein